MPFKIFLASILLVCGIHGIKGQVIAGDVVEYGSQFIGKPYKWKHPSGVVFDCSGFVSHIVQEELGIELAGNCARMETQVTKIPLDSVRTGDLIFFAGRNTEIRTPGHVALVVKDIEGTLSILHSCKRGVILEKYPEYYYPERFLFAGRFIGGGHSRVHNDSLPASLDTIHVGGQKPLSIRTLILTAVGDLMIGTNYPSSQYLPKDNGLGTFNEVSNLFKQSDIVFGNLEGCLLSGRGAPKSCNDPTKCYAFKSPDEYVSIYKEAGFNLFSLANNHMNDFGIAGRENTMRLLRESQIHFAGLIEAPMDTFSVNGFKIGFCAFAPNTGTVSILDITGMVQKVQKLDSLCDIVVVSFHGGGEGDAFKYLTGANEYYLGENRGNPKLFAHSAIDAGADLVLGHGPHLPRAIEVYKQKVICYSLGNFATYGRFSLSGWKKLAPAVQVEFQEDGEVASVNIKSFIQKGEGRPFKDETHQAFEAVKEASIHDFPESAWRFVGLEQIRVR